MFTFRVLFLLFTFGATTAQLNQQKQIQQTQQQHTKISSLARLQRASFNNARRRNANNNSVPILNESQKDILMGGSGDYADLIQRGNGNGTFGSDGGFSLMSIEGMFDEDSLSPGYDTALTLLKKIMIGKLIFLAFFFALV